MLEPHSHHPPGPQMALSEVFTWHRTSSALAALEALLRCSGCGAVAAEPRRYGRCAHVFCGPCADVSGTCTSCAVPSEAREQRADTTLRAVAAGCAELRLLFGLSPDRPPQLPGEERETTAPLGGQRRGEESPTRRAERESGGGGESRKENDGDDKARRKKGEGQKKDAAAGVKHSEKEKKAVAKGAKTKRNVEKVSGFREYADGVH